MFFALSLVFLTQRSTLFPLHFHGGSQSDLRMVDWLHQCVSRWINTEHYDWTCRTSASGCKDSELGSRTVPQCHRDKDSSDWDASTYGVPSLEETVYILTLIGQQVMHRPPPLDNRQGWINFNKSIPNTYRRGQDAMRMRRSMFNNTGTGFTGARSSSS